jgi:hypothetical protein
MNLRAGLLLPPSLLLLLHGAGLAAADGAVQPVIAASRPSGVAPLAVFFDATGTKAASTPQPFHDLRFDWDFNDPSSGVWGTTGRSRNAASGGVAGHVFETPGTFVVRLTVKDPSGASAEAQAKVVVEDPERVFRGEKTICVSSAGDFSGAPAGAVRFKTQSIDTLGGQIAAGKRILLRRGETWRLGQRWILNVPGPGIIGAFGKGDPPRLVLTGNQAFLELSGRKPNFADWRFMDLEIDGEGGPKTAGVTAEGTVKQALFLRFAVRNAHRGISVGSGAVEYYHQRGEPGQSLHEDVAIVDSTVEHVIGGKGGNASMLAAERLIFLGNRYEDSTGAEHIVRTQYVRKGVLSHNELGGPAPRKHVLKLHAPPFTGGGLTDGKVTELVVVSRNTLRGGEGDWIFVPGPEDGHTDQRVRDVVIEQNHFIAGRASSVAVFVCGTRMTLRNNLFDLSENGKGTCIVINRRGVEPPPSDIRVLNNTGFSGGPGPFLFLSVGDAATGTVFHNNLAAAPGSRQARLLSGPASAVLEGDNLLASDPVFSAAKPARWQDFRLGKGSRAVGAGRALPAVWDDFEGQPRAPAGGKVQRMDVGAFQAPPDAPGPDAAGGGNP